MMFRIDPQADEPLFAQLVAQVRLGVVRGRLAPGERLPAARELAEALAVNVHTVLRAYQALRDEGLVDLRRGRGAVVTAPAAVDLASLRAAVDRVADEARALALPPETVLTLVKEALR
ncbi:GntR family transcriptional regulator [Cellulosimicrobium cellulans]|uniref:GntR family transcriptional regulator n=1 Tax=Cellulosimicrobium cellulans TaxID=1710 RepID=UPI00301901F5